MASYAAMKQTRSKVKKRRALSYRICSTSGWHGAFQGSSDTHRDCVDVTVHIFQAILFLCQLYQSVCVGLADIIRSLQETRLLASVVALYLCHTFLMAVTLPEGFEQDSVNGVSNMFKAVRQMR